ncbi:hypothetical protein GUJ93_ZPchr0010g9488 [Zizania palustris]|uniref:CCHC-type domain-containing protein n=1 Tax=Zizania palustris TaxID=103762 RepID=A0A8J6BJL6_ZIZPA|nr:hypothetical protein GUJ93_ZPchr0010g9488 [Zizania palustris]
MAGSESSVHGSNRGDEEPPVARAELRQLGDTLLQAMERMLNERLPAAGGRDHQHPNEESGDENSGFGDGFHGHHRGGQDGDRRARRWHGHDRHVHFHNEEEIHSESDGGFDDNENPFADHRRFGHHHGRRGGAGRAVHHGRHNRDDPDNIARVKLSVPKFTGREDADAYLEWEEQCDQIFRIHNLSNRRCIDLASVEFSGYALTWWNQIQESQLVLGRDHINTWDEMKRVMRRRFVPSSYQRDLRNRLQNLKQGSRSVDDYYKEMELLLVRTGTREDVESKMARFLHGLNDEISGFVEMFPYHNPPDLVDQAMRTERKIQQEVRRRTYGSQTLSAPWRKQQGETSYATGRSQTTARPTQSIGATKPMVSTTSAPSVQQQPQRSTTKSAAPSVASAAASSSHSREIVCHKCKGHGHIAAQCPSRRTMIVNEQGEWESESDQEDDAPRYDEEIVSEGSEIQPEEGDNNCFISRRALNVNVVQEDNEQRHNLFHTRGMIKDKLCRIIVDNGSCNNIASQELVDRLGLKQRRHPEPYKMQWLSDSGALRVNNMVTVPFSIGRYHDEMERDVVPMQACQLLLGRPWLFDRDAQICGRSNKVVLTYRGEKLTLLPLTPSEILKDDLKRKQRESEKQSCESHQHREKESPRPKKTP